jgi:Family of unknown function (DUF6496)
MKRVIFHDIPFFQFWRQIYRRFPFLPARGFAKRDRPCQVSAFGIAFYIHIYHKNNNMPRESTIDAAKRDKAQGKSTSTQAGEFVKEEMDKIRSGQTGARNTKQAIAIGLSEARRSGVALKAPEKGKTSEKTRKSAQSAYEKGQRHEPVSPARSRAREKVQKKEPKSAASPTALSRHARTAAQQRTPGERSAAAKKAAKTRAVPGAVRVV